MVLESNRVVAPVRIYLVAGSSNGRDGPVVLQGTIWRDQPAKLPR